MNNGRQYGNLHDGFVGIESYLGPFPARIEKHTWNGWAMPRFTRATAERLTEVMNAAGADSSVAVWKGEEVTIRLEGCDAEVFTPDELGLYRIGWGAWTWDEQDVTPRETVLAILGRNRNIWMRSFACASSAIARAVGDGRISAEDIVNYPKKGYPEEASRSLALAAGLRWHDPDNHVDAEDVGISVQAIRGIVEGDAGIEEGFWYLYDDDLTSNGTTLDAFRAALRLNTVAEAGQLIVDADDWYENHI